MRIAPLAFPSGIWRKSGRRRSSMLAPINPTSTISLREPSKRTLPAPMTSPSPSSEKWLPKSGPGAKGFLILLGKTPKSQSMSIAAPSGPRKSKWALSNPKWAPSLPQSPFWRSRSVHWGVKINCYWKKTSNKMKELRRKTNILWNSPRETQRKPNLFLTSMRLQNVIDVRKSKSKWKMTMMMSRRNWTN